MAIFGGKNKAGRQRLSGRTNRAGPYYRQPSGAESRPPRRRTSIRMRARTALAWVFTRVGLMATLAAFVFWGLTSSQNPKVVVGSGVQYRPTSEYQSAAASKMHSVRDLTKFTFDTSSVEQYLSAKFPEIVSDSVELPLAGRQPVVRISIAKPALYLISASGEPEVVGSEGKIIGSAKSLHISAPMPKLSAGSLDISNDQVLGAGQVSFIENVQAQLDYAKIQVDHYAISGSAQELDLYLKGSNYYVKFNFSGDGAGEAGSYLASAHYFRVHHIHPSHYVDVRVSGKVFYK